MLLFGVGQRLDQLLALLSGRILLLQLLGALSQLLLDGVVDEASEWQCLVTELQQLLVFLIIFILFVKCH